MFVFQVTDIVYNFQIYPIKYALNRSETADNKFDVKDPDFKSLTRCGRLCLRALFEGDMSLPVLQRNVEGDASEAGILKCMECIFSNVQEYRSFYPKVAEIPFNSTNKYQVGDKMGESHTSNVLKIVEGKIVKQMTFSAVDSSH